MNRWTLLPSRGFFIVTYSGPLRKAAKGPGYIVRGVPGRATTTHRPDGAWEPIGAECWRRDGQRRAQTAAMPSGIQNMRGGIAPAEKPGGVLLHKKAGRYGLYIVRWAVSCPWLRWQKRRYSNRLARRLLYRKPFTISKKPFEKFTF